MTIPRLISLALTLTITLLPGTLRSQPRHDLRFDRLANVWDEAIPLGNGTVGALIWQKDDALRFSLDRSDIWDLRPMKGLHREEFSYQWVYNQVVKKDYQPVQEYFDAPYDREPAPSKIPAGALEFALPSNTTVKSVHLQLENALCEIQWENGAVLKSFVHATEPVGWFRFENWPGDPSPVVVPPPYEGPLSGEEVNSLKGDDLARLGYTAGKVEEHPNRTVYTQEGWGGFRYQICVVWNRVAANTWEGVWSISSHFPRQAATQEAAAVAVLSAGKGFFRELENHRHWWHLFWSKSSLRIPDALLEKQWYLEQYKFGATARKGAPPISLQAVWTADNGRIPPWKGDYHHDLNTQLSYWPAYSGNHLEEAMGYLDHLDANKANYRRYTKRYFGVDGIAVPGVTTLDGTEMGGWIQYSLSPTVSAWLAQHYYLQWRYSMDRRFLEERAYPWIREVCTFLEAITAPDAKGFRKLPISSSPEINDNQLNAWFHENTNYDLALMKFAFKAGAELAAVLDLSEEARRWQEVFSSFDEYALTENKELMFAPGSPYTASHRHFSHLLAIHPLGLLRWEDGEASQAIIRNSLNLLQETGPDYWVGYSYSWLANLQARAKNGDAAVAALRAFATAFCLPNSFHANGDQTKSGYSKFTYRPFTLEGNFAFAAGLQEMLLQSHAGFIEVFPAIPGEWKTLSFQQLRAEGAFLVSAALHHPDSAEITIESEKGGTVLLKLPFNSWEVVAGKGIQAGKMENGLLELTGTPGGRITVKSFRE